MSHKVSIKRKINIESSEIIKEIWANIKNKITGETIKQRIWWEDKDGIFHDESNKIPINFRDLVDNAWIEQSRKW